MTIELHWMLLTVLMTGLFWVPYVLERMAVRGIVGTLGDSDKPQAAWAQRAIRAHGNAVENLAIFVPAVLALHVLAISTPTTQMAATVYFYARLGHFIVLTAGLPVVRTLTFLTGWAAQMVLLAAALGWA